MSDSIDAARLEGVVIIRVSARRARRRLARSRSRTHRRAPAMLRYRPLLPTTHSPTRRTHVRLAPLRPKVGQRASMSRTIEADIVRFTEISGDRNPLHYYAAAAARTRFWHHRPGG